MRKSKTYKACKEGQFRNPKTNRCKKVATAKKPRKNKKMISNTAPNKKSVTLSNHKMAQNTTIDVKQQWKNMRLETRKEVFDSIENKNKMDDMVMFEPDELKALGLDVIEFMPSKEKKEFNTMFVKLSPEERAEIEEEDNENHKDIATIQKFTGNKQTKTEKAQKWLYEMYA